MGGTLTADHFAARYLDFREITYVQWPLSLSLSLSLSLCHVTKAFSGITKHTNPYNSYTTSGYPWHTNPNVHGIKDADWSGLIAQDAREHQPPHEAQSDPISLWISTAVVSRSDWITVVIGLP